MKVPVRLRLRSMPAIQAACSLAAALALPCSGANRPALRIGMAMSRGAARGIYESASRLLSLRRAFPCAQWASRLRAY